MGHPAGPVPQRFSSSTTSRILARGRKLSTSWSTPRWILTEDGSRPGRRRVGPTPSGKKPL